MEMGKMINGKRFFGIAAGIILAVLAVYPQYNLQKLRGDDFAGAFASCDLDEMAYASYLQALIDGRPRRNDPYTGRDHAAATPQPESLFSIQFFPAYLVAVPARIFGLSASQAMPVVSAISAFLAALALFWLIVSITKDALLAFAGTLVVMFGSALIVGIGAINGFYESGAAYPFFPFLRRYIPSLAFPFMFAFFACLWNGLQAETKVKRAVYSAAASLCFAALVFSYFYVWTAAGAVLFGLTLFVIVFRTENWRDNFIFLAITGAFCTCALVPYALLLAKRDETMDKAQLLVLTRQPDLLRTVEVIGYIVLTVTTLALWRRYTKLADAKAYFIAAFAFAPLLVFNQQIITNRSLQPFHYEFYVINYVVLLAVFLASAILWQTFISPRQIISTVLLAIISVISIFWGYIEASETTKFWDSVNVRRDEAMPVNRHLRELANGNVENARRQITFNLESIQADSQPTVAPQAVLWARHQHVFAGLEDWEENKRRYYQMLYYSDLNANWLRQSLTGCRDIEACMALFGWDRFNARLSANARPMTAGEIDAEVNIYAKFSQDFSLADAQSPPLAYVVAYNDANVTFNNLDLWYERGAAQTFGKYTLYEVKLKKPN
ncbi:MAG: hypothetical protein LH614_04665 [Pyrinomonadaceae bacterium]|nr:hypothetical protein [Pyrinomonadaceae bacterium]